MLGNMISDVSRRLSLDRNGGQHLESSLRRKGTKS